MILAGDIGGTKAYLVLIDAKHERCWIKEKKYASQKYRGLEEIIKEFLSDVSGSIEKACFSIAGPVKNNQCKLTNLPWVVDAKVLERECKISEVNLINDLEATAWGVFSLQKEELFTLNEAETKQDANRAVIAAGTGLGEAGIFFNGKNYYPFASEGGHCDFAPLNELEIELWQYLKKKFEHVSYERVLSGPGLQNIFDFFVDTGKEKENQETKQRFQKEDPPKVIAEMALNGKCAASIKSLDLFVSIYGSEASNLALKLLANGGVYLGGGIAPKILPWLKKNMFMNAFLSKGRFREFLSKIPVRVILNPSTAIFGAYRHAKEKR